MKLPTLFPILATFFVCCSFASGFQQGKEWIEFSPPGIKGKLQMPLEPTFSERTVTVDGVEVVIKTFMGTVDNGNLTYVLSHNDFPEPPDNLEAIQQTYDNAIRGAVLRVEGELRKHEEVTVSGVKGREIEYTFTDDQRNDFKIQSRYLIHGGSMFQLNVVAIRDRFSKDGAKKFFDSFRILKQANPPADVEEVGNGEPEAAGQKIDQTGGGE